MHSSFYLLSSSASEFLFVSFLELQSLWYSTSVHYFYLWAHWRVLLKFLVACWVSFWQVLWIFYQLDHNLHCLCQWHCHVLVIACTSQVCCVFLLLVSLGHGCYHCSWNPQSWASLQFLAFSGHRHSCFCCCWVIRAVAIPKAHGLGHCCRFWDLWTLVLPQFLELLVMGSTVIAFLVLPRPWGPIYPLHMYWCLDLSGFLMCYAKILYWATVVLMVVI